jgi:predicted nucleotidyltransferase
MGTIRKKAKKTARKAGAAATEPVGLADALFTKVQQRVLGLLFGNPGRSFYANELIELAGSGTGAVQRELARLESSGLATVTRVGNQKHYQANPGSPVYAELRGLVLKTSGLVDVLRAALQPLKSGIENAFVYGSVAKQQDTADSDIDLMVISDTLSYAELFGALEDAAAQLGRTVNPTVYSRRELDKRLRSDNAFIKRVWSQPRLPVIGDLHDFAT